MGAYFLGIDNGGTMTKSALFDQEGNQLGSASRETPVLSPREGWYQRDMEELWQATAATIRGVLEKTGVSPREVLGVGCTGHGKGLYLWGRDGRPAYDAIASTDHRAQPIVDRWRGDGTADKALEKTLQRVIDCQPAPLLRWMKEQQPEVYENIRWIFEAKDYIRFRLTGEAFGEVTDYSGTSLMNLTTQSFDRELLALYGLEEVYGCLPPLKYSYENCGRVTGQAAEETGLLAGTPVCGGMFDIDACAIAMDVTAPESLCTITGTWSINEYPSPAPVSPQGTTLNSLFALPGYYLIEESSPTSAGNLEWILQQFCQGQAQAAKAEGSSVYRFADREVEAAPPSGMLFLPFLYGSNQPGCSGGALVGMSSHHTLGQVLRAVFEGVAFSHYSHIEKLLRLREAPKAVRIAGGAVNSQVWLQIFADVIGLPLEVVATKELGAMGCAMAAAVCAGLYPDYRAAAERMVKVKARVLPDAGRHQAYQAQYRRYRKLADLLGQLEK